METMRVPPWLEPLLKAAFFSACRTHGDAARSECNMFCLDCKADAFCFYCRSSKHKDHQVIQIRRSSYHDVVRVSEIQKVLDISGVQTYVINSARVLFLNERPQPKSIGGKGVSHVCEICGRSLLDPFRFCSLGCKLAGTKRNGVASFALEAKNNEATKVAGRRGEGVSRRASERPPSGMAREEEEEEKELREGSQQDISPPTPPPPPNARRRKGIPRRAPFGS
ncbi:protein RGF1 INDUCIBLE TRANSCRIPTION FACTOR 1-like isoform X2 [Diospyros lotus]|uniref:protein RGF1 INDUCIBLE TRANSCRIPTION FACTOR 1-like isoform X2 n=1 Tax=Diospyros lotus TaxID=55363 RepID=UPI0022583784|nr:protein RGF1 INDUCIBLE TRANSCRIPTION FACTOR 1-like isoform X2 [Diospyros lotus]